MIIKPTMKFEMPKVKRFKLEEPDSEGHDGCSEIQKKRRMSEFYSHGDVEDFSSGSGSRSSEVSHWGCGNGEVQSNSNSVPLTVKDRCLDVPRPPLLKSSRGRLQTLPSRFSDSILDTWKNGGMRTEDGGYSFESDKGFVEVDRVGKSDGYGLKNSVLYEYPFAGTKVYERKRVDSSTVGRKMVRTESNISGVSFEAVDQKLNGNVGKRKDVYRPEDFALGDLVWAKCGKRYPAWPAMVIDPLLEAPEPVLSCCVPDALCVMFFGYSKNGTQRVIFSENFVSCRKLIFVFWWSSQRIINGQDYAWVKQGMIFPFKEFMDRCVVGWYWLWLLIQDYWGFN